MKSQVAKAALKGDIGKAKEIVSKNRHYWQNDPDSAMKTQSETLRRQKAARKSFLHDVLSFLRKPTEDGGPGSGNFGHAGRPGKKGGSGPGGGGSGTEGNKFVATKAAALSMYKDPKKRALAEEIFKDLPDEIEFREVKPGEPMFSSPIDNTSQAAYNGKATKGWKGLKAKPEVNGPKRSREFMMEYVGKNPEVLKEAKKFMDIRRKVNDFVKDHPEAENFNTYDSETGKVKNIDSGFCVTFHQNNTADDPLGGYSDNDYAIMCAIAMRELGADGVNIGYYGNPEVSFVCNDETAAKEFAVKHNQQSVYNASTGRTLVNKQWDMSTNPIRL